MATVGQFDLTCRIYPRKGSDLPNMRFPLGPARSAGPMLGRPDVREPASSAGARPTGRGAPAWERPTSIYDVRSIGSARAPVFGTARLSHGPGGAGGREAAPFEACRDRRRGSSSSRPVLGGSALRSRAGGERPTEGPTIGRSPGRRRRARGTGARPSRTTAPGRRSNTSRTRSRPRPRR